VSKRCASVYPAWINGQPVRCELEAGHGDRHGHSFAARYWDTADELETVTVLEVVRDEGSLVVFRGKAPDGRTVLFAAEHRPAQDIVDALTGPDPVRAQVASWQVLGGSDVRS
jgi:hypothetical protein